TGGVDERRQRGEQKTELEWTPTFIAAGTRMHERLVREFERRKRVRIPCEQFESVVAASDLGGEAAGLLVGLDAHLRRPAVFALAFVQSRRGPLALSPTTKCVNEFLQRRQRIGGEAREAQIRLR